MMEQHRPPCTPSPSHTACDTALVHVQAGILLLCRLLSWQRLVSLVTRHEALSFVVIAGGPKAGKATLFTRLVGAPEQYAATLGGTSAVAAGGASGVQAVGGDAGAPVAVDMRGIKGLGAAHAVVFPQIASQDKAVAEISSKLAEKVTGEGWWVEQAGPTRNPPRGPWYTFCVRPGFICMLQAIRMEAV